MQDGGESLGSGHAECLTETELVEQVVGNSGDGIRGHPIETASQQRDESSHGGRLPGHIGMDVHSPAVYFVAEEEWGLALVLPVMSQLFLCFESFRKRWQLLRVVQQGFEPGVAVDRLKARDQSFQGRHGSGAQLRDQL